MTGSQEKTVWKFTLPPGIIRQCGNDLDLKRHLGPQTEDFLQRKLDYEVKYSGSWPDILLLAVCALAQVIMSCSFFTNVRLTKHTKDSF